MELLTLIIGILFGIWCINICENKNRTAWKGFLAGFFLGIFGVVICYMLKDKNEQH